jgi:hypothetical protein
MRCSVIDVDPRLALQYRLTGVECRNGETDSGVEFHADERGVVMAPGAYWKE